MLLTANLKGESLSSLKSISGSELILTFSVGKNFTERVVVFPLLISFCEFWTIIFTNLFSSIESESLWKFKIVNIEKIKNINLPLQLHGCRQQIVKL